jgi:hypothetical protein
MSTDEYVRLTRAPRIIYNAPDCDACSVELESEDGWFCPSCGTSWGYDDGDGDSGILYEDWSGEILTGPTIDPDDWQALYNRAREIKKEKA